MKSHALTCLFALCALWGCAQSNLYVGRWEGKVMGIPLVLNVKGDTALAATLSSPSQGAYDIPCADVAVGGAGLSLTVPAIGASYAGMASADGTKMRGFFTQGKTLPLTLTKTQAPAKAAGKAPSPHGTREVEIPSPAGHLAGTLTVPPSPRAALVMVTGSGPQNRDEELFGHRPFAVLADSLASAGVATLRCDDRGVGGSSAGGPTDTTMDYADDAMAMLQWLRSQPEAKGLPMGILGHSEGGTIAFATAARHPGAVDFVVSLAGAAVSGREILVKQNLEIARAAGAPLSAEDSAKVEKIFEIIATTPDPGALEARLRPLAGEQTQAMTSPWYVAFVRLDPRPYIKDVKCPVLALNGTYDFQVDAGMNLAAVRHCLPSATTVALDGMNHLFQKSASLQSSMDYSAPLPTPDPEAIAVIAEWIGKLPSARR